MSDIKRELSIDALRGLAIIGMVLSGTIIQSKSIPSWMYHRQVGPPDFRFLPEIAGITWVDLVFPFFLFTMGLALPFALNNLLNCDGISCISIVKKLLCRAFNLLVFAIMIPHLIPYGLSEELANLRWIFAILGFGSFMLTFTKFPKRFSYSKYINVIGYISMLLLLIIRYVVFDASFSIHKNDIIILVLANMAIIAACIWIITRQNLLARIGVLAFLLSIWLTANISGSLSALLFQFTPLKFLGSTSPSIHKWLLQYGVNSSKTIFYSMYFMKYLFIVIPGTIIGDVMYNAYQTNQALTTSQKKHVNILLSIILFSFTIVNLIGLYIREPQITFFITLSLMIVVKLISNRQIITLSKDAKIWLRWSFFGCF